MTLAAENWGTGALLSTDMYYSIHVSSKKSMFLYVSKFYGQQSMFH